MLRLSPMLLDKMFLEIDTYILLLDETPDEFTLSLFNTGAGTYL